MICVFRLSEGFFMRSCMDMIIITFLLTAISCGIMISP